MSGPLVYTQTLHGGGSITLQFDVDWLSAPLDDCMFVRDLYRAFTAYPEPTPAAEPELPPAPPANPFDRGGGRPASVDYSEVAAVAAKARSQGRHMVAAIAEHFGISDGAAKARLKKARRDGLLPAERETAKTATVDFEELAAYVRDSTLFGMALYAAIAAEFDVTVHTARWRVQEARRRGILERIDPPASKAKPVAAPKPEAKFAGTPPSDWDLPDKRGSVDHEADSVYRCTDCGEERATVEGLAQHTYSAHQRPTRVTEQAAVRPKAAA